jgi:Polyketide cyclase / dehydrase and lipid transport
MPVEPSFVFEQSLVIPVPAAEAFERTLPISLPEILGRWYGPLPPIREVLGQTGEWEAVGQTRTIRLAGGATMREEMIKVDPPRTFAYWLTEISGPMALLIDRVLGEWIFAPAAGGTEVTWRWNVHRKSPATSWMLPLLGRLWRGYAGQGLQALSAKLTV